MSRYLFTLESKECNRPQIPKHGERIGSQFGVDSKVFFICDEGFTLHGAVMLKCLKNKTWSAEAPTCKGNVTCLDNVTEIQHIYWALTLLWGWCM